MICAHPHRVSVHLHQRDTHPQRRVEWLVLMYLLSNLQALSRAETITFMRNPPLPLPNSLPLHPAQMELQQYHPVSVQGQTVGGYLTLSGPLNVEALRRAIAHLPVLFDVFRWQFDPARTGDTVRIVSQHQPPQLPLTDLGETTDPERGARLWLQRQSDVPFATGQYKFVDFQLLRLSATEHWLLVRAHHLLLDDTGLDALLTGIAGSYALAIAGKKLPDSATSYACDVDQAQLYLNSMAYADDQVYWQKQFSIVPEPLLKKHPPLGSTLTTYCLSGSESFCRTLQQASARLNELPTHVLMAALTIYFARIKHQTTCVLGRVAAGRQTKAQGSIAGRFDRLLPIRMTYRPSQSLRLLIQTIRRQHRADNSRRQFPMSHLAEMLDTKSPRLFDVLVQHQAAPPALNLPGLKCRVNRFAHAGADVPLHVCWQETGLQRSGTAYGSLQVRGQSAFISESHVESLLLQIEHLLNAFIRSPDAPLAAFNVLPRFISEYLSAGGSASRFVRPPVCY